MNIVKRRTYVIDDTVNYIMKYVPRDARYSTLFPSFDSFYNCIANNASLNVVGEIYGGDIKLSVEILPFVKSYLDLKWKDLILSTYEDNIKLY
jgi:c-di-GMP-related signal transduction protein